MLTPVGPFLVPRAMPMLRKTWPDLQLFLREALTEQLLEGLADGRLDLIIVALPHYIGSIETELLFEDGYQLASPIGHTLAGHPDVTGTLLAGASLLLLEKGHCLQRHALEAYAEMRSPPGDAFAAPSLPMLLSMVEEGLGITLLPQRAIDAGIARGHSIDLTPLPDACPRRVVLGWRQTSPNVPSFRQIASLLRSARASLKVERRPASPTTRPRRLSWPIREGLSAAMCSTNAPQRDGGRKTS